MVTPIVFRDEVISAIHLANKPNGYDEEDRTILKMIADNIAPILYSRLQSDRQNKERKLAEETLRESEEQLQMIVDNSYDLMTIYDFASNQLLWSNMNWEKQLGYTPEKLSDPQEPTHPDDREHVVATLQAISNKTTNKVHNLEYRYKSKIDGTYKFYEASITRLLLKDKEVLFTGARDITERKQAEELLRESEEKYRSLVESTEDSIYLADKNCNYMFMNQKHLSRFGMPIDEILGRNYDEFHSEKETNDFVEKVRQTKESGESVSYEYKSERDGRHFIRTLSPVRQPDGEINAVTVISKDITEWKQAEERIKKQSEFLNSVIESLTHPFYVVDISDYSIKMANSAANMGRLSKDSTCYALTHREERPCESAEHPCPLELIKKTKQSAMVEHTHYDKDGNLKYFEVNAHPILDGKGNFSQFIEYAIDITERKKVEKAMLESEKKYRTLFEGSKDAVYIFSREGTVIEVNDAFMDLFGYSREEIKGLNIRDIYVNPEERSVFQQEIEQREFVKDYELKLHKKDEQEIDCLVTATVRKDDGGSILGYQGIIRDITDQKRDQENLKKSTGTLRILSSQLLSAQEKERKRISLELHDEMGQNLMAISFKLAEIEKKLPPEIRHMIIDILSETYSIVEEASEQIRELSLDLRPPMLDDLGVIPTLRWYINRFSQRAKLAVKYEPVDL